MKISRKTFEQTVAEALDDMTNVFVVVEDWPSAEMLRSLGLRNRHELLGVYQVMPLLKRNTAYSTLPDRIVIFQGPVQSICSSAFELREEIKKVIVHEVAHHFGISDKRLQELGY